MLPFSGDSHLRIAIGGFVFSVTTPNSDRFSTTLSGDYCHFVSTDIPVGNFILGDGETTAPMPRGEPIFDAGPNWRMYFGTGGNYVIETMSQVAICSPDFLQVNIHPLKERGCFLNLGEALAYPLPEIVMINLLGHNNGMLLHACGVVDGDGAYLFCGMSGGGKSTLADLWDKQQGVTVLSDDRIIVRWVDGRWMAFGTPWHGESGHCSALSAPVKEMYFIEHARENRMEDLSPAGAVSCLLARSFPPFWDKTLMKNTLEYGQSLSSTIPCCTLGVKPDKEIIAFVRRKSA